MKSASVNGRSDIDGGRRGRGSHGKPLNALMTHQDCYVINSRMATFNLILCFDYPVTIRNHYCL